MIHYRNTATGHTFALPVGQSGIEIGGQIVHARMTPESLAALGYEPYTPPVPPVIPPGPPMEDDPKEMLKRIVALETEVGKLKEKPK